MPGKTVSNRKSIRECIRHFTWTWHTVLMGTGAVSSLSVRFHFGLGSEALKVITLMFFFLDLLLFVVITGATIVRLWMFPETWKKMLAHPSQGLYVGAFAMGAAGIINGALTANQQWGFSGRGFLYALWGFWWLDVAISVLTAFILLQAMMMRQTHSLEKMAPIWMLPVVSMIVISSTGGLMAEALRAHSNRLAVVTATISLTLLIMGLSFALTVIEIFILRIIIYGAPDITSILSIFLVLGPLGQGGFSLLVNGKVLSELLPTHMEGAFPFTTNAGELLFAVCFSAAWILWSMGLVWVVIALLSTYSVARKAMAMPPFSLAYWGPIFPSSVYALLSVQLGVVTQSPFFYYFGAISSILVLMMWIYAFVRTIPAVWDTSIFSAPYLAPPPAISEKEREATTSSGSITLDRSDEAV